MFDVSQFLLAVFSCSAIWLLARKSKWSRWGYIVGLLSQPFWLYIGIKNELWSIVFITLFYTYSWSLGVYNFWIKKH